MKKSNNKTSKVVKKVKCLVDCTCCANAHLVQYDGPREPLLAECHMQPQPHNDRFPFLVEVARAKRLCEFYEYTDKMREVEKRVKVRSVPMACQALTNPLRAAI